MIPGKAGRVVNIASIAGRLPSPYMSAYVASKHGVVGFTESIRGELDKFFNIWSCTIEPFFVMTNIVKEGMDLECIKKLWLKVNKPDAIDEEFQEVKQNEDGKIIEDEVDDIMDVYDIEKYLQWKTESNRFIKEIAIPGTDHVIDAIICALSSVYPLKVYYPSWTGMIMVKMFKYILPGWFAEQVVGARTFKITPIKDEFLH